MTFHKYPSIPHRDSAESIAYTKEKLAERGQADTFVVQEKIHGGNFSLWYDGKTLTCAKRTAFLADDELFFNFQRMLERRRDQIMTLVQKIRDEQEATSGVVIYGEIFWGIYPEHKTPSEIKNIQTGVRYTNILDFVPFDIFVDDHFLAWTQTQAYIAESWFATLPVWHEGTLDECLARDSQVPSTLHEYYDLPPQDGNIAEGVIISHTSAHYKFKRKNPQFKQRERKYRIKKPAPELSPEALALRDQIQAFLDEKALYNRIVGMISKHGESFMDNQNRAAGLVSKDLVAEISERIPWYTDLEHRDQKLINKRLNSASWVMCKRYETIKVMYETSSTSTHTAT